MSIEALWAIRFASHLNGTIIDKSGGVIVLETERLFGGDSGAFYTGRYSLTERDQVSFTVQTGVHDNSVPSIFGGPLVPLKFTGTARVSKDQKRMDVRLIVDGQPNLGIVAIMTRVAELP